MRELETLAMRMMRRCKGHRHLTNKQICTDSSDKVYDPTVNLNDPNEDYSNEGAGPAS